MTHITATPQKTPSFSNLGLREDILSTLREHKITTPTPIQERTIPVARQGTDVLGIAQTGTGKTLAFVLPMLEYLMKHREHVALIVLPTRELAIQVDEVVKWFSRRFHLFSEVIIGGAPMHHQRQGLKRKPNIIVATPGRLIDHMNQKNIQLGHVHFLVLDEADRMFDMGFAPQIKKILQALPHVDERQTLLFSATMPDNIANMVRDHMHAPVRVEIATSGTPASGIYQEMIIIDKQHQQMALLSVLAEVKGSALIFTRTKHRAKKLTLILRNAGYRTEELHANRTLAQRKKAVAAMLSGTAQFLIATDIAARGIDIPDLSIVINLELPDNPDDYIHRIGRTARAGKSGRALSFVLSDQGDQLHRIQKLLNANIQQVQIPNVPVAQLSRPLAPRRRAFRPRGRGYRRK